MRPSADRERADRARAPSPTPSRAGLNAEAMTHTAGPLPLEGGIPPVMRSWSGSKRSSLDRFRVADGPEIENDWTIFTALNSPENHPPVRCRTRFMWKAMTAPASRCCCAPTHPMHVRYARPLRRRQGDRAGPHLPRRQRPPIRPCSTRSKACGSLKTSALPT